MVIALKPIRLSRMGLFLLVITLFLPACDRYNYYPRGVHQDEWKKVGTVKKASGGQALRSDQPIRSGMYTVKLGDTLYNISRRSGVDYHLLAKRNNIKPPYIIYVGQSLTLKTTALASTKLPMSTSRKANEEAKKYPVANQKNLSLSWPVKGHLTSKFGPRKRRMHDGIDIGVKAGTPVAAAAAGLVVYADSRLTGYGNLIIIRHSSDLFTAYAHNQKNLVKRGDQVVSGQRIALVGTSGRSTGPHLHFEVRRGETAVDPLAYLPKRK